jgi:hypothetical protein
MVTEAPDPSDRELSGGDALLVGDLCEPIHDDFVLLHHLDVEAFQVGTKVTLWRGVADEMSASIIQW